MPLAIKINPICLVIAIVFVVAVVLVSNYLIKNKGIILEGDI